jgi:3-oxoadipate enol-lactonase
VEGRVEVNGVNLWYRISGDGDPVVQIHGAGFGHYNFDPSTPELARHFRVVDYDMRGYGDSDRPVQHYDMEVWADDLASLMDALEVPSAHVHGSSMGGMIAIVFAAKYPERTDSVVINCAAAKLGMAG